MALYWLSDEDAMIDAHFVMKGIVDVSVARLGGAQSRTKHATIFANSNCHTDIYLLKIAAIPMPAMTAAGPAATNSARVALSRANRTNRLVKYPAANIPPNSQFIFRS
tara:strand:+ start:111 stop:434 length:324 start_codon:yes stop_codon:yes gene_type:complete